MSQVRILDYYNKYKMTRWRLMNRSTGKVVEISARSLEFACSLLGWEKEDVYWIDLGEKGVLCDPKDLGYIKY